MTASISSTALAWLLTYAIHSSVLLGLAWLLVRVRSWTPGASEILWKSAMLGGILTASVQLWLDVRPTGTFTLATPAAIASVATPDRRRDQVAILDVREAAPASQPPADPSRSPISMSRESLGVLVWGLVALVLAFSYIARRLILVGRLGDRVAVPDESMANMLSELSRDAGLGRPPLLTTTPRISSPIALGVREICVPETALTDLDGEQQRSMLAHELAHLARQDPLWLGLASLIERVLWIQASPLGVPVAGMAEERSLLVSRVARLLEGVKPSSSSRRGLVAVTACVLVATIAIAPGVSGRPGTQLLADTTGAIERRDDNGESVSRAPSVTQAADGEEGEKTRSSRGDTAVVLALVARLADEDAGVRRAAAQSLGKLQDARAVPGLIGALKDSDPEVRASAAEALGEFQDARAIAPLLALLDDTSTDVRQNVLEALRQYEDNVVPSAVVVRLLGDSDAGVRHRAAHLAGKLRDRASLGALVKLVRDPSADLRQAAIEALGELKDPSAASAIDAALADPDADVRQQALNSLEELRAPIAEATLMGLMRDADPDVRQKAAHLAGERSITNAVPALRRMLDDPNGGVRESAVEALSNIADPAAQAALRAALTSKDAKVRRAAAEALGDRRP